MNEKENVSSKLEWFKQFNELVGKLSYPLIIVILVFYIIDNSQFQSLLNKITTAKIGNTEFTFQAIEDEAETKAKLNSHVQELHRKTKQLEENIRLLIKRNNQLTIEEKEQIVQENIKESSYAKKAKYSILIFNRASQVSIANQIVELLLQWGYSASRITTDLSEFKKPPAEGTVYITRNDNGDKIIDEIISRLKNINPSMVIYKKPTIQLLRRGDVQISIF